MKKWLALFLAAVMLLSATACGKNSEKKESDKQSDNEAVEELSLYDQAMALIEDGDLEAAYLLLKDVEDTEKNLDAIQLRDKLVWMPVDLTLTSDGEVDYAHCSYDGQGRLVTVVTSADFPSNFSSLRVTYTANGETIDTTKSQDQWEKCVCTFDDNGNLLSEHITNSDDTWESTVYTYDKNGNYLTAEITNSDGEWDIYTYTYDKNGNLLTEKHVDEYGSEKETTYTYDKNGNILTENCGDTKTTYTYDINGNCTMEDCSASDGQWEKTVYTYDENGNCLSEESVYSNGNWFKDTYTYDKDSNLLTEHCAYSDRNWYKYTYTYDENGNLLSWQETQKQNDSEEWLKFSYTCDENGNMSSRETTSSFGDQRNDTFSHDEYGNLLTAKYDDGLQKTATWKLCYYPNGLSDALRDYIEWGITRGFR